MTGFNSNDASIHSEINIDIKECPAYGVENKSIINLLCVLTINKLCIS